MTTASLKCISPIDGSVYLERPLLSLADATQKIAYVKKAQAAWSQRTLQECLAFVEKAIAIVDNYTLGNPLEPNTTLGPMATPRIASEVRAQIDEAIAVGATGVTKLHPADDGAAYLSPAILTNVDHAMCVMRDENFGPVVGIMPVEYDAQTIELMNDSNFGLIASIWSADESVVQAIGEQLDTGTVFMNRCDYLDPEFVLDGVQRHRQRWRSFAYRLSQLN